MAPSVCHIALCSCNNIESSATTTNNNNNATRPVALNPQASMFAPLGGAPPLSAAWRQYENLSALSPENHLPRAHRLEPSGPLGTTNPIRATQLAVTLAAQRSGDGSCGSNRLAYWYASWASGNGNANITTHSMMWLVSWLGLYCAGRVWPGQACWLVCVHLSDQTS